MECPNCGETEEIELRLDNKVENEVTLYFYCRSCSFGSDYCVQDKDNVLDELLEEN